MGAVVPSARARMFPALSARWKIVVDDDCATTCRLMTHRCENVSCCLCYSCYCYDDAGKCCGQKRSGRNVTHAFNESKHILMLVLLYAQYCVSCSEDLSNYCEADCTLIDCSNGTLCMHHPKPTNYPAVVDPQARCLSFLIK